MFNIDLNLIDPVPTRGVGPDAVALSNAYRSLLRTHELDNPRHVNPTLS